MAEEYESAEDKLNSMLDGSFDFEEGRDENEPEPEAEQEEVEVEDNEDTDQEETETEETEIEDDTEEPNDEEVLENVDEEVEDEEEETEENAPVEDDEGKTDKEVTADEEETKDADPEDSETKVDYRKAYEELQGKSQDLQAFHDIITGEFKANGKTVKGFSDPHKVVQSMQAYHGLESKMKTFKEFKPILRALKERGMTDDLEKFDLAMALSDGNQEALKKQLSDKAIDPLDMDMDNVQYERNRQSSSPMEMALDDVLETAARNGVQPRMEQVLSSDWDQDSVVRILERPQDGAILAEQMSNGVYDAVQERIAENTRTDVNGMYRNMSMYDQYKQANEQLETEYRSYVAQEEQGRQRQAAAQSEQRVVDETAKIADAEASEQYRKKVQAKEKVASEARAKATSVSKPKSRPRKKKAVDPLTLSGDKFQSYFDDMLKF